MTFRGAVVISVIVTAIPLLVISIACDTVESSCVSSQNKIDWREKPVIDERGFLTFSGNTKDGARVDANPSIQPFNFSNRKDAEGLWDQRLAEAGAIGGYDLSTDRTKFSARYRVPDELLDRDRYELVVGVWGADPSEPLGAWCVKYE